MQTLAQITTQSSVNRSVMQQKLSWNALRAVHAGMQAFREHEAVLRTMYFNGSMSANYWWPGPDR
jgi:hypothetical protein